MKYSDKYRRSPMLVLLQTLWTWLPELLALSMVGGVLIGIVWFVNVLIDRFLGRGW